MADHQTRIRKRSYEVLGADVAELNSKKWLVNHVGYVEDGASIGDSGGRRVVVVYVLWGELEEGSRKYILVNEGIGVEEVRRMVTKIIDSDLSEHKLWYNLKYDRQMFIVVEKNMDVRIVFKGNDEDDYLYVGGDDGPRRQTQKGATANEGRTHTCDEGGGGCVSDHQQSKLRVGEEIIKLSNDN
ncbi:hypothetical protein Cgig2_028023 [Carnegiea gigantea]|uniref:Uncharacterized protein n=1 Tax=Carnegiea gigantea TaxID=171969 RepID=A0A9Q1GLX7_9CARY|nr:hypothetical protein Cgig2_028023 [Carnegiea gigantea]